MSGTQERRGGAPVQCGGVLIADLGHFLGLPEDASGSVRRLAQHLGDIVRAGTAGDVGDPWVSALPCRRRPAHRRCPGRMTIAIVWAEAAAPIRWWCTVCDDEGVISNWADTLYDLRRRRLGKPAQPAQYRQQQRAANDSQTAHDRLLGLDRQRSLIENRRQRRRWGCAGVGRLAGFSEGAAGEWTGGRGCAGQSQRQLALTRAPAAGQATSTQPADDDARVLA